MAAREGFILRTCDDYNLDYKVPKNDYNLLQSQKSKNYKDYKVTTKFVVGKNKAAKPIKR